MSFIEIKNLKKIYNANKSIEVEALKSINLIIEKGDFCSIVGVSGSGKSTLLYILGCIDKQTEGTYLLEGKNVSKMSENELAQIRNKKIGFVLQDFGLIEEETVIENVRVPILFCKDKNLIRNFRNKAEKLLKDLGIENLKDKKVNLLSGGQRQRVAIARALINDPELILADEPTGSLDTNTAQNIMNIFKELNKSGKTIIIVTHNMELARERSSLVLAFLLSDIRMFIIIDSLKERILPHWLNVHRQKLKNWEFIVVMYFLLEHQRRQKMWVGHR